MFLKNKIYYTYEDITIIPSELSSIDHRIECSPYDENGMLPLFTAPMNTVVGIDNFELFENEKIYPILPRTEDIALRIDFSKNGKWSAYSLNEFEETFCHITNKMETPNKIYALIDVANGHMKKIIDLVKISKSIYGDGIVIMAGNIANPRTYEYYADAGIDYVRCSVGTGSGCISSSNLGIHMPIASLIDDIVAIKEGIKHRYSKLPKIVADGGIRNYRDINKALALGADYVMCGSIFSKMLESSALKTCSGNEYFKLPQDVTLKDISNIHKEKDNWVGEYNGERVNLGKITALFYGMASREGQIALNGSKTKTSEGIAKTLSVEYSINGWVENFKDYLRSAMSYVGVRNLEDFRNKSIVIINSQNAVNAVNK